MGFMFRVRLSSFFAGAATASVVGFYLLYKDYMVAHEAISGQVSGIYETLDERYEALNRRITALENLKEVETAGPVEGSE
ncbi:uncharacterized protein LOC103703700 [Phoenix dactylifera]|uniref:Uncharacterized protein LOC103703700 n=1 Tax=Phoenix dactylifera TaxID=42345 RepID=A0A8B7BT77_PHODC|nr:uncharacterized protein LOC103703700 [Phoenix dactylifera]XP_008784869.1 uncharacterized protein LOC103703700 [Phoenix dactylifera]XP_008784870.1 uncharacterized protein LOC103703700 [Phoenix dactylifera]